MELALARLLLEEIPVAHLRRVLDDVSVTAPDSELAKGGWCGVGCNSTQGNKCGLKCAASPGVDVIDPEGRCGITQAELNTLRADLPALRRAVLLELNANVEKLKSTWRV
jgi:hypothetical protein